MKGLRGYATVDKVDRLDIFVLFSFRSHHLDRCSRPRPSSPACRWLPALWHIGGSGEDAGQQLSTCRFDSRSIYQQLKCEVGLEIWQIGQQ